MRIILGFSSATQVLGGPAADPDNIPRVIKTCPVPDVRVFDKAAHNITYAHAREQLGRPSIVITRPVTATTPSRVRSAAAVVTSQCYLVIELTA